MACPPLQVDHLRGSQTGGLGSSSVEAEGSSTEVEFEDVSDLFDTANPGTDSEKALIVGYWLQEFEGRDQLEAQQINNELKNLGHGVNNITSAFTDLMNRQPRLVRQVSKSGSARQARKKYKITREGVRRVQAMISGDSQNGE